MPRDLEKSHVRQKTFDEKKRAAVKGCFFREW